MSLHPISPGLEALWKRGSSTAVIHSSQAGGGGCRLSWVLHPQTVSLPSHYAEGSPAVPAALEGLQRGKWIWEALARTAEVTWKDKLDPLKVRKKKNPLLKL